MKFKNKITGSTITTENEFVIKQMQNSETFAEIKESKKVEQVIEQPKENKKKLK